MIWLDRVFEEGYLRAIPVKLLSMASSRQNDFKRKRRDMVKNRCAQLCFLVFSMSFSAWSVDTTQIEEVRSKLAQSNTQPDAAALQVIDNFWRKSIDQMMLTEDTDEMVTLRQDLEKFKGENSLSFYASAYLKTGHTHLKVAIDTVGKWEQNAKKVNVERNLMILITRLGSVELADLVMGKLSDVDPMVRYWAVRSLTSEEIISQLKSDVTGDEKLTAQIISALEGYLKTSSDTLPLSFAADFAAAMNTTASRKLLYVMADRRIDAYMKWTVTDESVDAGILKSIGKLIPTVSDAAEKQELLSRFGQLYSCVVQRYMLGENLPQSAKDQLVTVIAEVEDNVISKQIPGWMSKFRIDLSKNMPMDKDYEFLFGTPERAGELAGRLGFNYGKNDSGKIRVSPISLPPAPKAPVAEGTSKTAAQP